MKRRDLLALDASLVAAPAFVSAQSTWPTRGPIKLVAQFPPGELVYSYRVAPDGAAPVTGAGPNRRG